MRTGILAVFARLTPAPLANPASDKTHPWVANVARVILQTGVDVVMLVEVNSKETAEAIRDELEKKTENGDFDAVDRGEWDLTCKNVDLRKELGKQKDPETHAV